MARLACSTLSLLVVAAIAPAQDDPRLKPTLKDRDLKVLNKLAQKWIAAEMKWDSDPRRRKQRDSARDKFMTALQKKGRKSDVLGHVGDALRIFEAAFPYKRQSTSGEIKKYKNPPHHVLAPKGYQHAVSYPSVLVLPGWDEKKKAWSDPQDYINATWKTPAAASTFIVLPELRKGDDYDSPTRDTDKSREDENLRIRGVLSVYGEVQRTFRLDRRREFLDCGVGTCGFGLRLLTYFPSRFAGAILRAPTDVDTKRFPLDGLAGLPLLLVSTDATKANCDKIKKLLDALQPGMVTIVPGKGAPPHDIAGDIETWIKDKQRPLFPSKVIVMPTKDRLDKSHWVDIISCEPLELVQEKTWPRLEVVADHEKNRIVITSRSVNEIGLYLNDYLVDLDKEVTIVVNGKERPGWKFQRNINEVGDVLFKWFDPTAIYPAYHRVEIPSEEKKDDKGEGK